MAPHRRRPPPALPSHQVRLQPSDETPAGATELGGVQGTQTLNQTLNGRFDNHWTHFNLVTAPDASSVVTVTSADTTDPFTIQILDDQGYLFGGATTANGTATVNLQDLAAGGFYVRMIDPFTSAGSITYNLSITGPTTTLADLVGKVVLDSPILYPGEQAPATVTVTNVGSVAAAASTARLVWSVDGNITVNDPTLAQLSIPALAPDKATRSSSR